MGHWRGSRPRDSALTLPDGVPSFHASHSRAILRLQKQKEIPMAVGKVSDASVESDVLKSAEPVVFDFWA